MELYFFYKREYRGSFYNCSIEAWEENNNTYQDGKRVSAFTQLERVKIHLCKDPGHYHSARFDHDFSGNSCYGHFAKALIDFRSALDENGFIEINHSQYQRFKKIMFRLYQGYPLVNFTERLLTDPPFTRILF